LCDIVKYDCLKDPNKRANGEAPFNSVVEGYVGMGFPKEMVVKGIKEIGNVKSNKIISFVIRVCNFCFNRVFRFQGTVMLMHCSSYFSHIRYLCMRLWYLIYPIIFFCMVARISHYNWSYEMQTLDEEAVSNCSTSGLGLIPQSVEDDDDLDFGNWDADEDADRRKPNSDGSGDEVDDSLSLVR
jgi:hypothetical protein